MGIRFKLSEVQRETQTLSKIAKRRFFDRTYNGQLEELESNIENLRSKPEGTEDTLELRRLVTRVSEGEHEAGNRKGRHVRGVITGIWDVKLVGKSANRLIEFCGKASLKTEVVDANDQRVAMWRTELGADDSPGCYFHVQILGDLEEPPFPDYLAVPRFPSLFVTPMAALEHTLGELFQDRWSSHLAAATGETTLWRTLQEKRLRLLLDWQARKVQGSLSSPWMALKEARPDPSHFLKDPKDL